MGLLTEKGMMGDGVLYSAMIRGRAMISGAGREDYLLDAFHAKLLGSVLLDYRKLLNWESHTSHWKSMLLW
jgi:hypothetical protein